jgi:hypothetical protein
MTALREARAVPSTASAALAIVRSPSTSLRAGSHPAFAGLRMTVLFGSVGCWVAVKFIHRMTS